MQHVAFVAWRFKLDPVALLAEKGPDVGVRRAIRTAALGILAKAKV